MAPATRYPSKERVSVEAPELGEGVRRLKYAKGAPIPATDVETLTAQGYLTKSGEPAKGAEPIDESAIAEAQTAERLEAQTAAGDVSVKIGDSVPDSATKRTAKKAAPGGR